MDSVELIRDLARAHVAARCLHIVADFGVADALGDGTASAAELAAATGFHPDALARMLRLLAAHGVFAERDGGYAHNDASRRLRSDHPESLRAYARLSGQPSSWDSFTELRRVAETGEPSGGWSRMLERHAAHPEEAAVFNEAMVGKARRSVPAVVDAYDWTRFGTIVDVGGGRGHLLRAILERAPRSNGILFDLERVAAEATSRASPRMSIAAGDFFTDPLPAADAYVLMDVLHDWTDANVVRILAAIRRAVRPGARVVVIETLVTERPGMDFAKLIDVVMLAVTGGRERTPAQFVVLLDAAGFAVERVLPTASEYSLLEAVAR